MTERAQPHELEIARVVGARLRELRIDAELTTEQVAQLMGSHRPIVSRLENGKHDPDLNSISRYARALGLDLADVLVCLDPDWRAADTAVVDMRDSVASRNRTNRRNARSHV